MDKTMEQDKYKYRPQDWQRRPRLLMVRLERALRSLEKRGVIKFVNGRWYATEATRSFIATRCRAGAGTAMARNASKTPLPDP